MVRIALPGVGERLVMNLALLDLLPRARDYGTVAIAAYTVGVRMLAFSWIPGTGFAHAAATLVGQALGAGDVARARARRAGARPASRSRSPWCWARSARSLREPLAALFT